VVQVHPDFVTDLELSIIWLLWGWHGRNVPPLVSKLQGSGSRVGLLDGTQVTDNRTLLANRDARTEVRSFQIYNFQVRAQIGTSNVENYRPNSLIHSNSLIHLYLRYFAVSDSLAGNF